MAEARIRISLEEGVFELEGSESFVTAHIEKFADAIQSRLKANSHRAQPKAMSNTTRPKGPETDTSGLDEIFAATETGVQILKDIPGDSKAEKTVNAAKLLLYGLGVFKQKDTVLFEEVAAVCKAHGFYDSNNLAANLKEEKEMFVFGGSGKKQTLKLTVPGTKTTAKLVEDLKAASGE